jgi:putative tryptophan/tyrosine transport system substrate-binding protein
MQFNDLRRREFITLLSGAAAWPLAARAQEPERAYRIGVLNVNPRAHPIFVALFDEMRRLGFVEGRNLIVDGRGFAARYDQFSEITPELAKGKVDAILCGGGRPSLPTVQQVKQQGSSASLAKNFWAQNSPGPRKRIHRSIG